MTQRKAALGRATKRSASQRRVDAGVTGYYGKEQEKRKELRKRKAAAKKFMTPFEPES